MTRDSDGERGDSKKRPLQVSMTYALHCLFVNTTVIPIWVSATSLQISMSSCAALWQRPLRLADKPNPSR